MQMRASRCQHIDAYHANILPTLTRYLSLISASFHECFTSSLRNIYLYTARIIADFVCADKYSSRAKQARYDDNNIRDITLRHD